MKKDIFFSGTLSKQTSAKIATDVLMLLPSLYLVFTLQNWFWVILAVLSSVSLLGDIIMFFTKVRFTENYVTFHNQSGLPCKIAYNKVIGIYDTPNPAMLPLSSMSGTIRISYLSADGKLRESAIAMKDHDAVYCELSARCPHVPFATNEYENPLFKKYCHYNKKLSQRLFIGYITFCILLLTGLTYWAFIQHDNGAFTIPACIFLITTGFGVIYYKKLRNIDRIFSK